MARESSPDLDAMESALSSLAAVLRGPDVRLTEVFHFATEVTASCLNTERVGIWLLHGDAETLRCEDLFVRSSGTHVGGEVIALAEVPRYAAAMRGRTVAADDAMHDPRTAELAGSYLRPLGIHSMLDCPLFVGGSHRGVLCCEHVGQARSWRPAERLFASAVGDLVTVALSIVDERQARVREQRSEALYRSLVEDQQEFIVRTLRDGTMVFANRALVDFLGVDKDHVNRHRIFDFVPKSDRGIILAGVEALTASAPVTHYSHRILGGGDAVAMVQWRLRAFFDDDGAPMHFQATGRDVTAERLQQEQVREGNRLEAMALLAGGVVHDLNNILTPIAAYADLAIRTLPPERPEVANMHKILAATDRGHELATQVSLFSRREYQGIRKPLSISRFVRESTSLLAGMAPIDVLVEAEVEEGLIMVANPSDVHQILSNLVGNAVSYMPDGGRVVVQARRDGRDHLRLEVIDDGPGIDAALLDAIFEPFFTTRQESGGTGLGLAVVSSLVDQLGGTVSVCSEAGHGAAFVMRFPALPPLQGAHASVSSSALGGASVLVVDDDADIVEFIVLALTEGAYAPEGCTSPHAALSRLEDRRFDLLVTDFRMPRIDGIRLAGMAREKHPDMPVLLVTGHSGLLTHDELREHGIVGLLPKPFTVQSLAEAVEAALG